MTLALPSRARAYACGDLERNRVRPDRCSSRHRRGRCRCSLPLVQTWTFFFKKEIVEVLRQAVAAAILTHSIFTSDGRLTILVGGGARRGPTCCGPGLCAGGCRSTLASYTSGRWFASALSIAAPLLADSPRCACARPGTLTQPPSTLVVQACRAPATPVALPSVATPPPTPSSNRGSLLVVAPSEPPSLTLLAAPTN